MNPTVDHGEVPVLTKRNDLHFISMDYFKK